MSEFSKVEETATNGILRYKGRKCGDYIIADDSVEVEIYTATGKAAWAKEFDTDDKISAFFSKEPDKEDKPVEDEPSDEELLEKWKEELLAKANAEGNIATILTNGDGRIYKGPLTKENIKKVEALEEVREVLNVEHKDK